MKQETPDFVDGGLSLFLSPKGSLDPHSQGFDPHSQGFGPQTCSSLRVHEPLGPRDPFSYRTSGSVRLDPPNLITVPPITVPEVRYDWIPRVCQTQNGQVSVQFHLCLTQTIHSCLTAWRDICICSTSFGLMFYATCCVWKQPLFTATDSSRRTLSSSPWTSKSTTRW